MHIFDGRDSRATRTRRFLSLALVAFAIGGGRSAWAHQDPPGCSGTGVDFRFDAFRSDGSPLGIGDVSECETITYQIRVGKSNIGNPCAFEGGTIRITTPDGVVHNVTPGGGVPCIGGTGACATAVVSSMTVNYTVNPGDVVGGMITATGQYNAAFSHTGTSHTLNSPNAGGFIQNMVMFCPADTPCVNNFCDPNLFDSATGALGNCTFANIANSTPCPDSDGNQCTFAGCDGAGNCDQNHQVTVCPPDGNPCTNDLGCDSASGACVYTPTPNSTPCPDTDGSLCTTAGCNGAGTCDQSHMVTVCPSDGNPCTNDLGCDSATGACVYTPVPDSTPCPDTIVNNCTAGCNAFGQCDQLHICMATTTTSTSVTSTTSSSTTTTAPCVSSPEGAFCNDMIDNDCDGLIDCSDPDCRTAPCVGGTQNGQSCATPALQTACATGGGSCPCPPIQKDPTTISFGKNGKLDRLHSHGRVTISGSPDVRGSEAGWLLDNNRGRIFGVVLPANTLAANASGTLFTYRNLDAKTQGGIYRATIRIKGGTSYAYSLEAYGNMSAATDPNMAIQFYMGHLRTPAIHSEAWTRTKSGWRATGIGG